MANKIQLVNSKLRAPQGRNLGPINSKPQSISMERVKPGYRPEDKVTKPGGK
jgi:hypothetical protein